MDISTDAYLARMAIVECFNAIQNEQMRPSVVFRPRVFPDGNAWCALLGEDLQMGVAGFGSSPDEACRDFDRAWYAKMPERRAP